MSDEPFQVRYNGALDYFPTFAEALMFVTSRGGTWKLSWSALDGRFIIYSNGLWEHRTVETLLAALEAENDE